MRRPTRRLMAAPLFGLLILSLLLTSFPPFYGVMATTDPVEVEAPALNAASSLLYYPLYFPGDATSATSTTLGTPFAAFVSLQGYTANSSGVIKSRIGPDTSNLTQATSWMGTFWGGDATSWATCYPFPTDASGNWSGWIVAKALASTSGASTDPILYRPRFRIPSGGSNQDFSAVNVTRMTMTPTGAGGWVEGHVYQNGAPAANLIVVVKNASSQIIGTYITENNNVEEGYPSADTGYYKVGAPAGTGFSVEVWDQSANPLGRTTSVNVAAGAVTSGVDITTGNPPVLNWTGEPGYTSDGLQPESGTPSTSFVYRVKFESADNVPPAVDNPKVHIFKDTVEITGSPFPMVYVSGTPTAGAIYSYTRSLLAGNYSYHFGSLDANGLPAGGPATALMSGPVISGDTAGPTLYNPHPARFSSTYLRTPTISFQYLDNDSGIDISSVQVWLDGVDYSAVAMITPTQCTYLPPSNLPFGSHTVTARAADLAGNSSELSWNFSVIAPLVAPEHFLGDIHSHTSYSDGAGTPFDAFTYARDTAAIDFLGVTDHSNSLTDTEWADVRAQANTFTVTGSFVGLAGFEWTNTQDGHINVYQTDTYVSRNDTNYDTLAKFYGWLKAQPTALGEFNHPFSNQEFQGFAYDPLVDAKITMQEVGNGSPPYSYARLEAAYIYALDKGWHVGATNNQDNHAWNWGYPANNMTGIVADQLTKDGVLAAMRDLRTYGSEDRDLHLGFQANDYWMGTTIECATGAPLQFKATVSDATDPISQLQIITTGGVVLASQPVSSNATTWDFTYTNPGGGNWYYLRAIEADGDLAISSPIWTASGDVDLKITGFSASPVPTFPGVLTTLTANVSNYGLFPGNTLTVSIYAGTPTDGTLIGARTLDVAVGKTGSATVTWTPVVSGNQTLTAVLTAPPEDPKVDNTAVLNLRVIAQNGKKVLIDRYHKNDYASTTGLGNLTKFVDLLRFNGYQVFENAAPITPTSLTGIDVLVVTFPQGGAGQQDFNADELTAVRNFVLSGKALLYTGKSNYGGEVNTRYNDFLASMGVGIAINGDNIYDKTNTYGYDWSVNLYDFPPTPSGISDQISNVRFFSGASLIKQDKTPLVADPSQNIEILAFANNTSYDEDDVEGATHVTSGYWTYSLRSNPSGAAMPAMAVQSLPAGGRVAVLGRAIFSNYEMGQWLEGQAACNNEAFSLNLVDWLANYERVLSIAEARAETFTLNTPAHLGEIVTVRGVVTAGSGTFFDVLYLQDATGGISVFGTVPSDKVIPLGAVLQVTGVVDEYNGDLELKFNDFYQDFLWQGWTPPVLPMTLDTGSAMLPANEGWLVETTGLVTQILDAGSCLIDDGSGPALIFVDGYIGQLPDGLQVGDTLSAVGLAGEFAGGHRLRVRNPSELVILPPVIAASPGSFLFNATREGADPLAQNLQIQNEGGGTLSWNALGDAPWLSLTPTAGTNNGDVLVEVHIAGLAAGTYTAVITITAAGAANSPLEVPVTLTVEPQPPAIGFAPSLFTSAATPGEGNPPDQILNVWNNGDEPLNWTVAGSEDWLTLLPTSGSDDGSVAVEVDTTGLVAGTYTALITITAPDAVNNPQQIPVTLTVAPAFITLNLDLVSGWNMISLPLVLADANPDAVFPAGWPLFLWDAAQGSYKGRSQITLAIGVGYWLKAPSAQVLAIDGLVNPSTLQLIPLSTGWNLIGTPYHQPVAWSSIHVRKAGELKTLDEAMLAGWIKGPFYRWSGSTYELIISGGIFQPTSGYWLKGLQDGCTLEVAKP